MQASSPRTLGIFGGKPKGAWSKVSPKLRKRLHIMTAEGYTKSAMARELKVSRPYIYILLRQEGLLPPVEGGSTNGT